MDIQIIPKPLRGRVEAVPSKSAAHRAMICAALASGESIISPVTGSKDMQATEGAISALGARVAQEGDTLRISGIETPAVSASLDCIESGSTLRFLMPVASALGIQATFLGRGRLGERPVDTLAEVMTGFGVSFSRMDGMPFTSSGKLRGGCYEITGSVSSQFITGLLLAAPLTGVDCEVRLTSPLQSKPYVDLTRDVMRQFGIEVTEEGNSYFVPGGQAYSACHFMVEGDYSNAAFYLCAGALSGELTVSGLLPVTTQGDRAVLEILTRMGASFDWTSTGLRIHADGLRGVEVDARDIPDLVPVLAATAALAEGTSTFHHAQRLRIKESDRLASTCDLLQRLGATISHTGDTITVHGQKTLTGGTVEAFNDHRMAMTAAVAAIGCTQSVRILGAQCVEKSYPAFFEDYQKLGGVVHVLNLGNKA